MQVVTNLDTTFSQRAGIGSLKCSLIYPSHTMEPLTRSICYGILSETLALSRQYSMKITVSLTNNTSGQSPILFGRLNSLISSLKNKTMHNHVDDLEIFSFFR